MANKLVTRPARKKGNDAPTASKSAPAALDITIDYPKEEELVLSGHYAVRITAAPDAQVELSVNDGQWNACRIAAGFHWFDWWPTDAGEIVLKARSRVGGADSWKISGARFCRVVNSKKA